MSFNKNNQAAWDRIASDDEKWFRSLPKDQIDAARTDDWALKITPTLNVPKSWFGNVAGKDVLCLAAGGGQQAPLLAAAGARVTVVDFSEKQLQRDVAAASEFGLELATRQSDMAELDWLDDEVFDVILNPTSVCYIPKVQPVWDHCFRVLRPGGRLIAGFMLPVNFIFEPIQRDAGKLDIAYSIPYSDLELPPETQSRILSPIRPAEFGHSLGDLIGGQTNAGFSIAGFYTDRWGDSDVVSDHIDVFAATLAIKP